MSKRILSICLTVVALVASTNAFASRARQVVMGSADPFSVLGNANHGTFFYDDNLNHLFNPSYANDHKNWAGMEKNNGLSGLTNAGAALGTSAEGGFVAGFNNWAFGAYMNRGDAMSTMLTTTQATTGTNTNTAPTAAALYGQTANMRPIDLTIAGDMGVKWGFGYTRGKARSSDGSVSFQHGVRAGAQYMDFEPYANMVLSGQDSRSQSGILAGSDYTTNTAALTSGSTTKYKSMGAGMKYHYGEWVPFAAYRKDSSEFKQTNVYKSGSSTDRKMTENTAKTWGLGLGRNTKVGDGVSLNYALSYWKKSFAGNTDGVANVSQDSTALPVDLSVENSFNSWLTGRAGVSYRLVNSTNGNTAGDNTTVRFGASFIFGKVAMDWAVGGGAAAANVDGAYFDAANGFFSTASMTYHW